MKKKIILVCFSILCLCRIFANEKVTLVIEQIDGKIIEEVVEQNTAYVTFYGPKIRSIKNIYGLEKLKKLENLEFYNLYFSNMDFISTCKNIKNLCVSGCTIVDFSYIEELESLEDLILEFYVDYNINESLKNKVIDIKKLRKLKKIAFSGIIRKDNDLLKYGSVPLFINPYSECVLVLGDQGITRLSEKEKEVIKGFKTVYLYANPVCNTEDVKNLNNIIIE